jgi:glyoxylase-like metal-dependent hydrolase (beta-lactamase superfamily II)
VPIEPFEVFAIRYACFDNRHPGQNFILADPHEYASDLDCFIWVARRNDCAVVIDTGFAEGSATRHNRKLLRCPVETLQLLSIDPEKVRDVIVTHLHYDHAGNLDRFPAARFHVQDREVASATGRGMCHSSLRAPFDLEHVLNMVQRVYEGRAVFHDGDNELVPGLSLHRVGGHSAGLQVVRVWTRRGWIVLASDAAHLYEHFQKKRCYPIVCNLEDMLEGYKLLYQLADSPGHIIPGHDPLVMRNYPPAFSGSEGIVVRLDVGLT